MQRIRVHIIFYTAYLKPRNDSLTSHVQFCVMDSLF